MKKSGLRTFFIILGIIAFVAGIAYVVYKYFFDVDDDGFLDDVDDAFDDPFEDDDPFDDMIVED